MAQRDSLIAASGIKVTKKVLMPDDSIKVFVGIQPQMAPNIPYNPKAKFPKVVVENLIKLLGPIQKRVTSSATNAFDFAPGYYWEESEQVIQTAEAFQAAHEKYIEVYGNSSAAKKVATFEDKIAALSAKAEKFVQTERKVIAEMHGAHVKALLARAQKLGLDPYSEQVQGLANGLIRA